MNPGAVIIDAPECRTPYLRWRDWMLTVLLWGLWFFICWDVLLFLGWVIGVYGGILQIDAMLELRNVADPLKLYCRIIVAIALLVVVWALCSRDLPDGRRQRPYMPEIRDRELAEFFNIEQRDVARCTSARRIVMHHHEDGLLAAIEADLVRAEERLTACNCSDRLVGSCTLPPAGPRMRRPTPDTIALTPGGEDSPHYAAGVGSVVVIAVLLLSRWLCWKPSPSPDASHRPESLSIRGYIG